MIAEHIVTDASKFEEYKTKVGPMIAKHGGRYLTKGAMHRLPEGGRWKADRVVIIEFPDMNSLHAWYSSPEYQPLIALRKSCTSDQDMLFVLEGAQGPAPPLPAAKTPVAFRLGDRDWRAALVGNRHA